MVDRTFVDQSSPPGCSHVTEAEAGLKPPRETDLKEIQKSFCDPDLSIYPRYDQTINSMLKIFNPGGVLNAGGLDLLGGRRLTAEPAGNGRGEPRETWM